MTAKATSLALLGLLALVSACAGPNAAGYGPVRIETYPLDGDCRILGKGYTMPAKAPADLVVPLSAAPLRVICRTDSGYKGSDVVNAKYDPWSPANVGSLGLGFLVDKSSGSGRRYPELVRVTMIYTEAGKPSDLKQLTLPTGAEMSKEGPNITPKAKPMAKETAMMEKNAPKTADLPAPPKPNTEETGMPAPPAKEPAGKATDGKPMMMKDGNKAGEASKDAKMAALPAGDKMMKSEPAKAVTKNDIRVHLSSFKDRKNAERSSASLRRTHAELLGKYATSIETVNLTQKGTFHRVYAGPMASNKAARDLCNALKNKKVYCRPVAAGAN